MLTLININVNGFKLTLITLSLASFVMMKIY